MSFPTTPHPRRRAFFYHHSVPPLLNQDHIECQTLDYNVISDNDFSATVVSYQKKGSGSHFVPFSLHVILSIVIYDRAVGRVCLPFSPLVFSPLLSQYPWPRRPLVTSHTRSPLGRTPGFTLTPVIFVIPGDSSFVSLCTHRAPGSSRPACFRKMRRLHALAIFLLGLHRFRSAHEGSRSDSRFRSCRNLQDLSYQKPLHSIQLQEGCLDPNLVLEPTALDLADLTSATTTSTFRTHPPAAVRVSG